jgi:aspartate racemase
MMQSVQTFNNMKTVGIISGMGTKAGMEFLNKFVSKIKADTDQEFPEFIFHNNSSIPDRTKSILSIGSSPVEELKRSIMLLSESKMDYIISTCVTSYHFINQFENVYKKKMINPVELIVQRIKSDFSNVKKIGLLATTGTIRSGLFEMAFKDSPFEIIILDNYYQEEKLMKSIYMTNGFKSSNISNEARSLFSDAVDKIVESGSELLIGACTEIQFGMDRKKTDLPYIDVIDIMVDEIINLIYNKN